MKSFHPLLFIGLLITQLGFGQSFLSGGIINQQDTTFGFIAINSNSQNASNCKFKKSESAEISVYIPDEIDGYFLENSKHYVSKTVVIDDKPRRIFLEYLLNGIVDLYYYNQSSGSLFFFENDEGIHVLTSTQKEVFVDGIKRIQSAEEYKGSLKYLLKDTPDLVKKIDQTAYSQKSLIELTTKYHNAVCDEYACIDYTKVNRINVEFAPYLGSNAMFFSTYRSEGTLFSITPMLGLRVSAGDQDSGSPWRLNIGFEVYRHKINGEVMARSPTSTTKYVPHKMKADFMNYKLNLGVNYHFVSHNKGAYISCNILTNYMNAKSSKLSYYQTTFRNYWDLNSDFDGLQYGLNLGIGQRFPINEKNAIEVRLDNSISTFTDNKQEAMYSTKQTYELSLSVGYVFLK